MALSSPGLSPEPGRTGEEADGLGRKPSAPLSLASSWAGPAPPGRASDSSERMALHVSDTALGRVGSHKGLTRAAASAAACVPDGGPADARARPLPPSAPPPDVPGEAAASA